MKSIFLFLFSVFLLWEVAPVQAQAILEIFKKPLPELDLPSQESFEAQTILQEEYPIGARELSYSMRIPKDWSKADDVSLGSFIVSDSILSSIAKYLGPVSTGQRHYMSVQAIGLEYQMTAKQWLVEYLLENKYSVQGVDVHNDERVEVLYIFVENSVSYVARAIAQINGSTIIFVQHLLPIEEWHDNKLMQAQVLKSFRVKYKNKMTIEKMNVHSFRGLADFSYPDSWELMESQVDSVDRMSVDVLNIDVRKGFKGKRKHVSRSLLGRINVNMVSIFETKDLDAEIELLKGDKLIRNGLFVQNELPDHNDFVFNDSDALVETHVYEVVDKHGSIQSYEYWVTITAHGDYFYITTLLTPSRGNAFFKWSRNTQAYKAICKSFKPAEDLLHN